ncbi:MAG: hypothetical protein HQK76_18195 [Desulfobacterales bacterium]|nr:hypothetical protein [Desulfobacterales bacterium]
MAKEAALREKTAALREKTAALREKERERQEKEREKQEKENIKRRSILAFKKIGHSNEEIAQTLNIPLSEVEMTSTTKKG